MRTWQWRIEASITILFVLAAAVPLKAAEEEDGFDRSVVLFLNHTEAGRDIPIGSGFLLRKEDDVLLVTADHVTQNLYPGWRLVVTGNDGRAVWLDIKNVLWARSKVADVAVTTLIVANEKFQADLLDRALPVTYLKTRSLPPGKDVPLVVLGFPIGIFSPDQFGPLVIETKVASGILRWRRFDTGKEANFIFLQHPSIGGLSGGPVLDTGKSYFLTELQMRSRSGISIVGLIHGNVSDSKGNKLAVVVPSTEILRLLSGERSSGGK